MQRAAAGQKPHGGRDREGHRGQGEEGQGRHGEAEEKEINANKDKKKIQERDDNAN